MKRLLLSTVLAFGALGAVAPGHASQYISPWYEGQWFCNIEGSSDRLTIRYWMRDLTTSFIPQASVQMTRWPQAQVGEYVVDHRNYITFYFLGDNQYFVRLDKPRRVGGRRFPAYGTFTYAGRNWSISCRKAR